MGVLNLFDSVIDKLIPDKDKRDEIRLKRMELEQAGEFKDVELRYEAIVAEAKSNDPWTSRARPSFMYIFYILLLGYLPFSIIYAFNPQLGDDLLTGMTTYFKAIPTELYVTFTTGYLGYSAARAYDKKNILQGKQGLAGKLKNIL